jgi:hypothetical protein
VLKFISTVLLIVAFPTAALAKQFNVKGAVITGIEVNKDGSYYLTLNTDSSNCHAAFSPKRYYVIPSENGATVDGAKNILATAMLSFSSRKTIELWFEATPICDVNRILLEP